MKHGLIAPAGNPKERGLARAAIVEAVTIWLVFGAVEACFGSIVPWILQPSYSFIPSNRLFTLTLLAAYSAVGAAIGLAVVFLVRPRVGELGDSRRSISAAAKLTLIALFAANFVVYVLLRDTFRGSSQLYAAVLAIQVIVLASVVLLQARGNPRWAGIVANSWALSFLLLAPWFVVLRIPSASRMAKATAAVLMVMGVCAVFGLLYQITPRWTQAQRMRMSLALAIAVAVISLTPTQTVRNETPQRAATGSRARPHIILITLDTVAADHLSLYGYARDTSPRLKSFAREAVLYKRAFSSSNNTLSTHASLFTGLDPAAHTAHVSARRRLGHPLPAHFRTLAEILDQVGYRTAGIVANAGVLGGDFGLTQGFQYYDQRAPVPFLAAPPEYFLSKSFREFLCIFANPSNHDVVSRNAAEINGEVFRFLEGHDSSKPFFLFINYMDAHWPYLPPPPYDVRFPGKLQRFGTREYLPLIRSGRTTSSEQEHLRSQYDGAIAYLDDQLALLRERLQQLGLYEETLLIITSDHGEGFGERGYVSHGFSVYQDQIAVPFIIRFPSGNRAGEVVQKEVSSVDLLPTILDSLQLPISRGLIGSSLHGSHGTGATLSEHFSPEGEIEYALVTDGKKLIERVSGGRRELYDLTVDPYEQRNMLPAPSGDRVETTMIQGLSNRLTDRRRIAPDASASAPPDSQLLRSLGYVR